MRVTALLAVACVLAGCSMGGTKTTTSTVTVTRTVTTQAVPKPRGLQGYSENNLYFGAPVSITRVDAKRYLLVLKPQFFLTGVTASVAFAASHGTVCSPLTCPGVANDYWAIPAGTANLTFVLLATTKGTVLTGGTPAIPNEKATSVTAAQLAALVAGGKSPKLFEPLDSGLWLAVAGDTVMSFTQQYRP